MALSLFLDKSALQALNPDERLRLRTRYEVAAPVLLFAEIAADLVADQPGQRRKPAVRGVDQVARLLAAFDATNLNVFEQHFRLVMREFAHLYYGQDPPITLGVSGVSGGWLMENGLPKIALARDVERLQQGAVVEADYEFARAWRPLAQETIDSFSKELLSRGIELPKAKSVEDAKHIADALLADHSQQFWLLPFFLEHCGSMEAHKACQQWLEGRSVGPLKCWAPYTEYCLRCLLVTLISWRDSRLSTWTEKRITDDGNNPLDAQYLYYLPFCNVFSSNDRLHRRIAPLLLQPGYQSFLEVDELRRQMKPEEALTSP